MTPTKLQKSSEETPTALRSKLWIYTNYDCNLSCPYCCAESSPKSPRRGMSLEAVKKMVDEAQGLGFKQIHFTGGEPFLVNDLYEMIAYASERLSTTVLTNAMLLRGKRLEKLRAVRNENLTIQVSLDGGNPEPHDAYRGEGSWQRTIEGIENLQINGFRVRLATTETPANTAHIAELCLFHHEVLGIPEEDHFVREMAKRGYASQGMEVGKASIAPEVTCNSEGVFWHPISTAQDMLVSERLFPLEEAVYRMQAELEEITNQNQTALNEFK